MTPDTRTLERTDEWAAPRRRRPPSLKALLRERDPHDRLDAELLPSTPRRLATIREPF